MLGRTLRIEVPRAFKPLIGPARYKGAYGGRGSAKSWFFAQQIIQRCLVKPGTRVVCLREIQKDLAQSAKLLLEDRIRSLDVPGFELRHSEIRAPGGGLIIFKGLQDFTADSIKSLEGFDVAWCEEAHTITEHSLELLRPTIRAEGSEIWFSWNPRDASDAVDTFLRGPRIPASAKVVSVSYKDNPWFTAALEEERLHDLETNPDRYGHIWEGDYEPTAIGAIWTRQNLNEHRRSEPPQLERIVVGVDPAISAEDGSNEHGIVVCARGADGRGYILEDSTVKGGPEDWAKRAVAVFDKYEANLVVPERNQGGDMVAHTLKTVRPTLPIKRDANGKYGVLATKGKHVRAEPIASLYQLGRVSHVGSFPQLEAQMCQFTASGYEGKGSPDRADALVWGMTELFPQLIRPVRKPVQRERPRHSAWGA